MKDIRKALDKTNMKVLKHRRVAFRPQYHSYLEALVPDVSLSCLAKARDIAQKAAQFKSVHCSSFKYLHYFSASLLMNTYRFWALAEAEALPAEVLGVRSLDRGFTSSLSIPHHPSLQLDCPQ